MSTGSAFMWPAWQASRSGLVKPDEVEAVATLNNLSDNVGAIIGPAMGGLRFTWIGPGTLFLLNALSFVSLLGVYWACWQERCPAPPAAAAPPEGATSCRAWAQTGVRPPIEQPGSDPSLCAETPAGLMRDEHNKYQAGASEQDRFKREDNQGNANTFRDFHGASFRDVATLIIA